ERVDFGEATDDKFYVIAQVGRGQSQVEWRPLRGIRPFIDRRVVLDQAEGISEQLRVALPPQAQLEDAIVRLVVDYPREWEAMLDEGALREYVAGAFEFHLVKRPQMENRVRLPEDQNIGSLSPLELLELYWRANHVSEQDLEVLQSLAAQVLQPEEE
ncbi:MAG: hypothetical protein JW862_08420, partial [Anaerolineales bacterium]|nr:hypothetical protein [Anaerolineales bacterium]